MGVIDGGYLFVNVQLELLSVELGSKLAAKCSRDSVRSQKNFTLNLAFRWTGSDENDGTKYTPSHHVSRIPVNAFRGTLRNSLCPSRLQPVTSTTLLGEWDVWPSG